MPRDLPRARLVTLASGAGTTLAALLEASKDGRLPADIVLLITNRSDCGAVAVARAASLPFVHLSSRTHADEAALDRAITDALIDARADLVVLAGYLRKLGPLTLGRYAGRILNTHPSLLPRFGGAGMYGARVHAAVVASGDRESGATVHRVTADYDAGEILGQVRVPVCPGDSVASLEARVKAAEKTLLIYTLAAHCG